MKKNNKQKSTSAKHQQQAVSKQQVRSMILSEVGKEKQIKFVSLEYQTTISDSYTQFLVPVNWPAQGVKAYDTDETGATQGQRVGNKIEFEWLEYNSTLTIDSGTNTTFVREIMFQWLIPIEHSDDTPTIGDILQTGAPVLPYICPLNYENRSKYKILFDRKTVLTTSGYNQAVVNHNVIRKLPVETLRFTGDAESGFSSGLIKGNIFVFVISDQDALVGHPPAYKNSCSFYYTD